MQQIDRRIFFNNHMMDKVSNYFYSGIDNWLIAHPLLHWFASHLVISLILGFILSIFIVRLLLTIYNAVASAIDKMWLWILQSPFLLIKLIFGLELKSKANSSSTTITNYEVTNDSVQLQEIMTRLEYIQQQQQQIIEDIALLKKRSSLDIQSQPINLHLVKQKLPLPITEKEI